MHIAEADSFLRAHSRFGMEPLDAAGRDGYVADMARIGSELGVPDPPRTEKELTERIAAYRAELTSTAEARAAARFLLLNPPLPVMARPPYGLLAAAAVSLLPGWARWPLRLPHLPGAEAAVVRPAGQAMVQAIRWATAARPADRSQLTAAALPGRSTGGGSHDRVALPQDLRRINADHGRSGLRGGLGGSGGGLAGYAVRGEDVAVEGDGFDRPGRFTYHRAGGQGPGLAGGNGGRGDGRGLRRGGGGDAPAGTAGRAAAEAGRDIAGAG